MTYGVEYVSALHHNKRKNNYHIHLIFSERKPLDDPLIKVASRSIFLDETGKRVRTKKEITDEHGKIRKGCIIIKKGEIHEKVKQSIRTSGWLPTLFRNIVSKAKEFLLGLMREQTMSPKPILEIDIDDFNHMTTLIKRVHGKADEIHHLQNNVLPTLKQQLIDTKGLFKK